MPTYFFNDILREHISVFGTLFSDILVRHLDESNIISKELKVPISYSNKDKFIQMYSLRGEDPSNYGDNIMMTLPRFGFEIVGLTYNPNQKINRLNKYVDYKENININLYSNNTIQSESSIQIDEQTKSSARSVYSPVTYKLHLNLYLMTNKETDSLQIMEQILPMFTPHVMVPVKYTIGEDIFFTFDESINLEGTTKDIQFNQDFNKITKTIHTFNFSMDIKFFKEEMKEDADRIIKHIVFKIGEDKDGEIVETVEFAAAPHANNIIVNIDKWYENFYNYLYHDLEGRNDFQILENYY